MLFFWNFLLRVGLERNGTTIFFFFICQPIPTYFGLKRSHNRVFEFFKNFRYFFGIFFYTLGWNETEPQFLFLYFSAFSNLFWLDMKPQWYYLIFLFFFFFFLEFFITRRVGTERNGKTIFIFSLSRHFPTYFGLKWSHNGIF